jgi:proteic killer suppression protein
LEVVFDDPALDRLETDARFDMGLGSAVVQAYRKRLQMIRSAPDERDFYALKSLHFERPKGVREGQRSMRLNDQFRLVLAIEAAAGGKRIRILGVEDYH